MGPLDSRTPSPDSATLQAACWSLQPDRLAIRGLCDTAIRLPWTNVMWLRSSGLLPSEIASTSNRRARARVTLHAREAPCAALPQLGKSCTVCHPEAPSVPLGTPRLRERSATCPAGLPLELGPDRGGNPRNHAHVLAARGWAAPSYRSRHQPRPARAPPNHGQPTYHPPASPPTHPPTRLSVLRASLCLRSQLLLVPSPLPSPSE